MINGTYQIIMKTLMGKKYGRLTLYQKENILSGYIDILGHSNKIQGEILADGSCRFSGIFITPMHRIEFMAEGSIDEKQLELMINSEKYAMPVLGKIETISTKGEES